MKDARIRMCAHRLVRKTLLELSDCRRRDLEKLQACFAGSWSRQVDFASQGQFSGIRSKEACGLELDRNRAYLTPYSAALTIYYIDWEWR
jgi:hypothetical protein